MDHASVLAMTQGMVARVSKLLDDSNETDKVKVDRLIAAWESYNEVLKLVTKRSTSKEADTLPSLPKPSKKRHVASPTEPKVVVVHDQTKREKTLEDEEAAAETEG